MIELGDLYCYDQNNESDYNDYITEEIHIADEEDRYYWEAMNRNDNAPKTKWVIKKEDLLKVQKHNISKEME